RRRRKVGGRRTEEDLRDLGEDVGEIRHEALERSPTFRCSAWSAGFARATESWGGASEGGRSPAPSSTRERSQGAPVKRPIAGGSGGAAGIEVALPHPGTSRPAGLTRLLESERLLAALLLSPTVVLLGVFIAYPFVMGVWLSLSSTSVGNPGT